MDKWSISNVEEVRFFREIQNSVAHSIMEIDKIFTEMFLVYPVGYLVLQLEDKLNPTKIFLFQFATL